jgi:hopene-associated glycosyltransferase HpnB
MNDTLWLAVTAPGALIWVAILLLPFRPWSTRERLEARGSGATGVDLGEVTALIPARDEAATISRTLQGLARQGAGLRVIVIDDRSTDGTAGAARSCGLEHLEVVAGRELPAGWSGKMWALEQGLAEVRSPYTLLLDADIELEPGILPVMLHRLRGGRLHMLSLMATLSMTGFWEKLLLPAFIYFFKLLYPFRLANSPRSGVAAAAGGCVLVSTEALHAVDAFASLKDELIDDCALAARLKGAGFTTWIGLSRSVRSHRPYRSLGSVWEMVARTAYTQLRTSPALLAGCVLALSWAFWLPLVGLGAPAAATRALAVTALAAMIVTYLPTLRYYRLSPLWALLLPAAGILYLAMTVDSARRFTAGVRSRWKGRTYPTIPTKS